MVMKGWNTIVPQSQVAIREIPNIPPDMKERPISSKRSARHRWRRRRVGRRVLPITLAYEDRTLPKLGEKTRKTHQLPTPRRSYSGSQRYAREQLVADCVREKRGRALDLLLMNDRSTLALFSNKRCREKEIHRYQLWCFSEGFTDTLNG